jgi:hypothetical protein
MKASPDLWVRTLLAGPDAIIALIVNDTSRGNKTGTTIRTVSPATVELHLPTWFQCNSVFEIDSAGTKDMKSAQADGRVTVDLGQVRMTRLVVLARDGRLREQLQTLYNDRFAETVRKLKQRK